VSISFIVVCVSFTKALQGPIALPYGLHSYNQLAAELTSAGIQTRCSPSIANRFALVRVPPKSWGYLRPILESALDIQFAELSSGGLEIRKDPQESSLEEALLSRFARQYERTVLDAVQGGWDAYEQAWTSSQRGGADPFENLRQSVQSLPVGNSSRNALNTAVSLRNFVANRRVLSELWGGIDLKRLIRTPEASIQNQEDIVLSPPDNPIGHDLPPEALVYRVKTQTGAWAASPYLIHSWTIDLRTFSLTLGMFPLTERIEPYSAPEVLSVVPNIIGFDRSWDDLIRGLPQESAFRHEVQASETWLKSEMASTSVDLPRFGKTLSFVMNTWSKETDTPVIMEILPMRDSIGSNRPPKDGRLSPTSFAAGFSDETVFPTCLRSPWSFQQVDGVLAVHDKFRFIDHLVQYNPAPEIFLWEKWSHSKSGLNSLKDVIEATKLSGGDDDKLWADPWLYRGLHQFPWARPYIHLLKSMPSSTAALNGIEQGGNIRIPYKDFPAEARRQFEKSVRQISSLPLSSADTAPFPLWVSSLLPGFDDYLDAASVMVEALPETDSAYLKFSLSPPSHKKTDVGNCQAMLGPIMLGE